MPLGLRTLLALDRYKLLEDLTRGAGRLARMTPKQIDDMLARALARAPQPPAPFELVYKVAPEGCYIWPRAAEPNPYG